MKNSRRRLKIISTEAIKKDISIEEVKKNYNLGFGWNGRAKLKIHVSLTNLLSIHNWLQKYLKLRFLLLFGGGRCLTIQNEGLGAF